MKTLCRYARWPLAIVVASVALTGCIGSQSIHVSGGAVELNPRLRADLGPSAGMLDGRLYADGRCPDGAASLAECHYVSPLLSNFTSSALLRRLRRSEFLWTDAAAAPILSWELVARGIDVVGEDGPIARDIDLGTCHGFPLLDPETRQLFDSNFVLPEPDALSDFISAEFETCVSTDLEAVSNRPVAATGNCRPETLTGRGDPAHPYPEIPPLCAINVGGPSFGGDASFALRFDAARPETTEVWRDFRPARLELLPHILVVPSDGVRTISRPLTLDPAGQRTQPDGRVRHVYRWRVDIDPQDNLWKENFSGEIAVVRARVRRGPWTAAGPNDYGVPLSGIRVGGSNGQLCTRNTDRTDAVEIDFTVCSDSAPAGFRVTPTYDFLQATSGSVSSTAPIDDSDRLLWEARIDLDADVTPPGDGRLFLELDLVSMGPMQTSRSGLMLEPPGTDLGMARVDQPNAPKYAAMLRNADTFSTRILSIRVEGQDASAFGGVRVRRPGDSTPLTLPLILAPGTSVEVDVTPVPVRYGIHEAALVVESADIRAPRQLIQSTLRMAAVSADVRIVPERVNFFVNPQVAGPAQAEAAFALINVGGVPIERRGVTIGGPHAADFSIVRTETGFSTSTDTTVPLAIAPGDGETYRLRFRPQAAGTRLASVVVQTSEGTASVLLTGDCRERCGPEIRVINTPPVPEALRNASKDATRIRLEPGR